MFLRLNDPATITPSFKAHLWNRANSKQYQRRGSPGRTFVALDEKLALGEMTKMAQWEQIRSFMYAHSCTRNLYCVSAQWLHANSARHQRPHRDHTHGYGRYFAVIFTIDASRVDTMLETESGHTPADCAILVYDTFHTHFGPSGRNWSKVFVCFADTTFDQYNSLAKQQLHGRKKAYENI